MTPAMLRVCCDDLIDRLRCERERQGVSQEEIMKRGGPTAQCQWDIENGHHRPRMATIIAYAEALGWGVCFTRKAP